MDDSIGLRFADFERLHSKRGRKPEDDWWLMMGHLDLDAPWIEESGQAEHCVAPSAV